MFISDTKGGSLKTRWHLPKSEQKTHSVNGERLKCAGLVIGLENAASSDPPILRIEQSEYSFMDAGTIGGMALAICVRITVLKSGIIIRDCEIKIPGCDADILPVEFEEPPLTYKALRWLDLEKGSLLNHRIFSGRPLPLDRNLDGYLVARSFDYLPDCFQSPIVAQICFNDQFGRVFTSNVQLILERNKQSRLRPRKEAIPAGTSYRHPIPTQDEEPCSRDPKPVFRTASAKRSRGQAVGR